MRGPARNLLLDLRALATLPGLDRLAAVLARHDPGRTNSDYASLLIYLAARWRVGSSRELDSLLADPVVPVWESVRLTAFGVGRKLAPTAPTYDMLYGYRERVLRHGPAAFHALLEDMQQTFTDVAVDIARDVGLLVPSAPDWMDLDRGNVVAVDGTFFKPASGVTVDEDGVVHGSRADATNPNGSGPRAVETRKFKQNNQSVPIAIATVRDRGWNQRIVLGVVEILEGSEQAAAHRLIRRIATAATLDSLHAVVYDRLFKGTDLDRLMRLGILPIVPMQAAGQDDQDHQYGWPITDAQCQARYRCAVSKQKSKVKAFELTPTGHDGCLHRVWAIDGSVVIIPAAVEPTVMSPPSHPVDIQRTRLSDGNHRFEATYEYDCGGAARRTTLELTGSAPRLSGTSAYMANVVRPIPDTDPRFVRLTGYRNDVESANATIKRPLHLEGRAISYDPDHFTLDAICGALLHNAIAWDLHGPAAQEAA